MTDRELLEMAAKAAGIEVWFPRMADGNGGVLEPCHYYRDNLVYEWNPLTDDGDAFRLAVKLKLKIEFLDGCVGVQWVDWRGNPSAWPDYLAVTINNDPYADTRRAIVRAAAEIGRVMV